MELSDMLILNPNYFIRHDETRSLLWARTEKTSNDSFTNPFHSFIHPYHGQLLSLFNGDNTVQDVLDKSVLGQTNRVNALDFIVRITGNKKMFRVLNKGFELIFPENLLLEKCEATVMPNIQKQDYTFSELDFKTQRLNFPLYLTYMINTICYTDCVYCYADCRMRDKRQLSIEKLVELFDEIEKHPVMDFTIMGGEFLLDENWEFIIVRLNQLGLFPIISTKLPISEDIIQRLKANGINKIQLSFDSANPDTLNKILKVNGERYLSDMRKTLTLLQKYEIEARVNVVITRYNDTVGELQNLLAFLAGYKISSVIISPASLSLYKPDNYMSSEEAIDIIKKYVYEVKCDFNFELRIAFSLPKECLTGCPSVKDSYFSNRSLCTGNLRQAFIMPNGDVTYCEGTMSQKDLVLGNMREKSFSEVWKTGNCDHVMNRKNYKNTVCESCESFDECHELQGVCWKLITQGYGNKSIYYPDPRCPKAPPIINRLF